MSQTTTILEEDFKKVLPVSLSAKSTNTDTIPCVNESDLQDLLKLHHGPLELSPFSYSDKSGLIQMLGLGKEQVFTSSETADMAHLYEQLNPGCAVVYVPPFYVHHGRIRIGSEVLGSALHGRSAKSSSVISAYWPTFGRNIQQFDQSRPSIGKVQYYFSHSVTLTDNQAQISKNMQYTFAYIHWMECHISIVYMEYLQQFVQIWQEKHIMFHYSCFTYCCKMRKLYYYIK